MSIRVMAAAATVQWRTSLRAPEHLVIVVTTPLLAMILLSITQRAGRPELLTQVALGTGLLGLWFVTVNVAAGVIENERWMGTLGLLLAAPRSLALVVCGRILPVMAIGVATLIESWLVAITFFDARIAVRHPVIAVAGLLVTVFTTACTATMLAGLSIISRNTPLVQSLLSYPWYVLGGLVFPLSALPEWLRPVGRLIYLSWSAELLRDSVARQRVESPVLRLSVVAAMGMAAFLIGVFLLKRSADHARWTGSVSLA